MSWKLNTEDENPLWRQYMDELEKMNPEEQESLLKVLSNRNVSSATISDLLSKYGYEISSDTIRRYRVKLKRNESD